MEYTRKLERLCAEQELKIALYEKALEQIANPIKYLQEEAKEKPWFDLDGYKVLELANDPIWLKKMAKEALADGSKRS